ncbi:MAG TPA: GNAT family N-acetyltransferase [Myxococcota bacterium]|nr:GNAT family N-acetyltransferase [Myxococcota bacterium]
MSSPRHRIVRAEPKHFDAIRAVERAAEDAFPIAELPLALRGALLTSDEQLAGALRDDLLWCALDTDDRVLGFAIALWLGRDLHLDEIDVLPELQRRGIGRALIGAVRAHAVAHGAERITLTTFRAPPWNQPWYARLGFVAFEEPEIPAPLREIYEDEIARGLARERRVAMALDLRA